MKSYTDLAQSKILAEILPIESADMFYFRQIDIDFDDFPPNVDSICPIPLIKNGKEDFNNDIPCWSLAALISILGSEANDVRIGGFVGYWWCQPLFSDSAKYIKNTGGNELVDVCCKIIFKLKEENLI